MDETKVRFFLALQISGEHPQHGMKRTPYGHATHIRHTIFQNVRTTPNGLPLRLQKKLYPVVLRTSFHR